MPDVKTIGYSDTEFIHRDVPKVWLDAPESTEDNPVLVPFTYGEVLDGLEFNPDFSDGDISIDLPEGYLAKSAVIKCPEKLTEENIRKDVAVAGIIGTYEGEPPVTQEVTVDLDFAEGDMVIAPAEDILIEKVTIPQPPNLVPGNIAEGVSIAGVVGTFAGGMDMTEGILNYFAFNINRETGVITIFKVMYDRIYEDTGSYDVTIPDEILGCKVMLSVEV